jgi:arsenite methyltransferase
MPTEDAPDQPGGATGLGNREKWAAFQPLVGEAADQIRAIRERVLDGADLRPGQRVLDVGAGTGLLALEACGRVAPDGLVVAMDISEGALHLCRDRANRSSPSTVSLHVVAGEALRLPFPDGSFDAATVRSVLMYVDDKPAAARELYRVLRPSGRAAVYEPINRHSVPARWYEALDGAALPAAHGAVVAELKARRDRETPDRDASIAFDERDLVSAFIAAGYSEVRLTYEYRYTHAERTEPKPAAWYLERSPYAEIARALLGERAELLLTRVSDMTVTLPQRGRSAAAHLLAWR